jgi:hypothetical protein
MPTLRKSPRKTKHKPDYYGGNQGGEDDIENRGGNLISGRKNVSEPSVKKKRKVGSKKWRRESQAPARKASSEGLLASSESEYEEKSESESESDDERKEGRRASASQGGNNKKASDYAKGTPRENEGRRVVGTRNSGAQEQGSDGTPSDDSRVLGTRKSSNQEEQGSEEGSRTRNIHKGLQRRMFQREEVGRDEDSDGEDEVDLKRQLRMMDRTIRELKRKNESLELRLDRETKMSRTNKSMLSGQEMNFVKDVNDFCKEKLFPREKFLRNNWQDYLPNDRRSFYRLCMDNLSIPEGSDPKDIWGRVVVPAVRDKYQSLKCNLNNKIKSVYMGMKMLQKCR